MGPFLPNLFLLGAAKCGTTTIHSLLGEAPDVCMSEPKEPFYFECEFDQGLDFYRQRYFGHWQGERVIGESRHRNLYLPYVPRRIHQVNPDAKLVVSVRDPVERAYSHWWHWYCRGLEPLPFADAMAADAERIERGIEPDEGSAGEYCRSLGWTGQGPHRTYLDSGYYHRQIRRYLELFPRHQLLVVQFETLVTAPEAVASELAPFVGVDLAEGSLADDRRENVSSPPFVHNPTVRLLAYRLGLRHVVPRRLRQDLYERLRPVSSRREKRRQLDPATRRWLSEHYRPHNAALASFLGRPLEGWT